MSPYNKDIQKVLHRLHSNPDAAIAKQSLISAAITTDIIINISNYLINKWRNGRFDRDDQLQLDTEIISFINYIAKHDYITFLVLVERFDEIREIFSKDERLSKQVAVAFALAIEKEKEQKLQILNSEQLQVFLVTQQKQQQKQQEEQLAHEKDLKVLMYIGFYQYFIKLEQEIHNNFYIKQIEIFDTTYKNRMERVKKTIEIASNDPNILAEDKNILIQLQQDYEKRYKIIQKISIYKADGSIDRDALKKKSEVTEELVQEFGVSYKKWMSKYLKYENIKEIYSQEMDDLDRQKIELEQNKQEIKEKLDEIRPYVEQSNEIVKEKLESTIKSTLENLNKFDINKLPEAQHAQYENALNKLNEYKDALSHASSDVEIKDVTNRFIEQFVQIKETVKSYMSQSLLEELEQVLRILGNLKNRININPITLEISSNNSARQEHHENAIISMSYKKQFQADKAVYIQHIQTQGVITKKTVSFDGEPQENLKAITSLLPEFLSDIIAQGSFNPKEVAIVSELQSLCNQIAPSVDAQVEVSKVELINELFNQLKNNHPELEVFSEKFNSVISALGNPPRLGA